MRRPPFLWGRCGGKGVVVSPDSPPFSTGSRRGTIRKPLSDKAFGLSRSRKARHDGNFFSVSESSMISIG